MYNETWKREYMAQHRGGIFSTNSIAALFDQIAGKEAEWGADICTQGREPIEALLNNDMPRPNGRAARLLMLRDYVRWCIDQGYPGACDGIMQVQVYGIDKYRDTMVRDAADLQARVDRILDPLGKNTVHVIYRCALWLAFCGVPVSELSNIQRSDVTPPNRHNSKWRVRFGDHQSAVLCPEAILTVKKAMDLTSFIYEHNNPYYVTQVSRVEGTALLRGTDGVLSTQRIQMRLSSRAKTCEGTSLQLNRVWQSGTFQRMYEMEQAGFPLDFTITDLRGQRCDGKVLQKDTARKNLWQYCMWKLAFDL